MNPSVCGGAPGTTGAQDPHSTVVGGGGAGLLIPMSGSCLSVAPCGQLFCIVAMQAAGGGFVPAFLSPGRHLRVRTLVLVWSTLLCPLTEEVDIGLGLMSAD